MTTSAQHQYRYGLQFRPAGLGTVPKVLYTLDPPLAGELGQRLSRHGVMVVDQPLAEKEVMGFELAVIADQDLQAELAIQVAFEMREYATEYLQMARDTPEDFVPNVAEQLKSLRSYPVYVGDLDAFALKVQSRLETLVDLIQRERPDAVPVAAPASSAAQ